MAIVKMSYKMAHIPLSLSGRIKLEFGNCSLPSNLEILTNFARYFSSKLKFLEILRCLHSFGQSANCEIERTPNFSSSIWAGEVTLGQSKTDLS